MYGVWLSSERQAALDRKLVTALRHAQYAEARTLLEHGADPNTQVHEVPPEQWAPVREAWYRLRFGTSYSDAADPPLLLGRPRLERSRRAAVLSAADEASRAGVLASLIRHGARVDARSARGLTLVQTAAADGDATLLNALLAHGASQRTAPNTPPPLNLASGAATEILVRHGADVNALFVSSNPSDAYLFDPEDVATPLSHAARRRDLNALRLLLEKGAVPRVCTKVTQGAPPGHASAHFSAAPLLDITAADTDILELFLHRYGDLNRRNESGITLLEEVVTSPYLDADNRQGRKEPLVRLLLGRGASPTMRNAAGVSAVEAAAAELAHVRARPRTAARAGAVLQLLQSAAARP